MANQNQTSNSGTSADDTKRSNQVRDTDAALTDKDRAATTLNPNPNLAKPDPTMGTDEGWKRDAASETMSAQNVVTGEDNRRDWQNTNWQDRQTNPSSNPTTSDVKSQAKQAANDVKQSAGNIADQAKQTANDVKQSAGNIADQAKQAAVETVDQAKQAVNDTLGEAKQQVAARFDAQKSQAADRLSNVANALRQTGENLESQNEDTFGQYARAAADQLEQFSNTLQNKNMNELLNEVQGFARRQPELFIAGSLAAGFLLGRFLKSSGSRTASYNDNSNRRYGNGGSYSSGYGQSSYNKSGTKHSTTDAIARMDYESPAPQNIAITKEEDRNAR